MCSTFGKRERRWRPSGRRRRAAACAGRGAARSSRSPASAARCRAAPPSRRCRSATGVVADRRQIGRQDDDRKAVAKSAQPSRRIEQRDQRGRWKPGSQSRYRAMSSARYGNAMIFELIEARHAVGLGPQRHAAGFGKGPVGHAEQLLAVIGDGEAARPSARKPELCHSLGVYPQIRHHPAVRACRRRRDRSARYPQARWREPHSNCRRSSSRTAMPPA